jgi:RNA polymerase sigma factor (sigma-70 family)
LIFTQVARDDKAAGVTAFQPLGATSTDAQASVPYWCVRVRSMRNAKRVFLKLAFGAICLLDRTVSDAPQEVTSATATGLSGPHGGAIFTTTHWSIVLEAQGESLAAQEALEKLCRTYWRPIFAFLRRQGIGPDEAEDITQGFFAELLERRSLDEVRKEKGRLRSFLLGGLKYFLANEQRRAMAIKRGKGQRLIPLDELQADDRSEIEPADPMTPEMIYERRWALTVLERVLSRLKDEYLEAGNAALFDSLKELLPDEPGSPSQAEIGARLGMTENAIRQAFYRFRQRYQSLLREEIANTVATPGDIEDELRHLIAVLEA